MSLGVRLEGGAEAISCGTGRPRDEHGIAFEQRSELAYDHIGNLLLACAGQEPPSESGYGCVACRMRSGNPRLSPHRRCELAGYDGDHEQDDDRDDVRRVLNSKRVMRRRKEEVVGECGGKRGEKRWPPAARGWRRRAPLEDRAGRPLRFPIEAPSPAPARSSPQPSKLPGRRLEPRKRRMSFPRVSGTEPCCPDCPSLDRQSRPC